MKKVISLCLSLVVFTIITSQSYSRSTPVHTVTSRVDSIHKAPEYDLVFPQDKVNTLEIAMTKTEWEAINADMKKKYHSDFGKGGDRMPFPGNPNRPPMDSLPRPFTGGEHPAGPGPGGFGGGGPLRFASEDPDYVPVTLRFNAKEWRQVGFRLKGNSSLSTLWRTGSYKLPFRLNFGKFKNTGDSARFHGFKELSLSPAFHDNSLIREKVAADLFRNAGVPAAQTAFYKVYINFGEGKKYCGVYTMVEVIDDTMVKSQFGEDEGNIYKPESTFQRFSKEQFEKKNNKKAADWTDVQSVITILNSPSRTQNPASWRTELENVFNVDTFLKWLAVNTTITSWDSYGAMAHNYYVYNSPDQKLTWIPWDLNETFQTRNGMPPFAPGNGAPTAGNEPRPAMPQGRFPGMGPGRQVTLALDQVGNEWPLIRYLANDSIYFQKYKRYVKEFTANSFTPKKMNALFEKYFKLVQPYAIGSEPEQKGYSNLTSSQAYQEELDNLKKLVVERNKAVSDFLK